MAGSSGDGPVAKPLVEQLAHFVVQYLAREGGHVGYLPRFYGLPDHRTQPAFHFLAEVRHGQFGAPALGVRGVDAVALARLQLQPLAILQQVIAADLRVDVALAGSVGESDDLDGVVEHGDPRRHDALHVLVGAQPAGVVGGLADRALREVPA